MATNPGRQSGAPILVTSADASALRRIDRDTSGTYDEAFIQELVFQHPETLPVDEVDSTFNGLVPLCRELRTNAGPVDAAFINAQGLLTLVECKLWRNPQARREVVGQILDYAKELSRWRYEDLEREVSRRLDTKGNVLYDRVVAAGATIAEDDFADAVTRNLRQGRFLLLVVGDGIREGVEAIGEYLSGQAGLHFVFGLVEMPVYELPNGDRLVHPRILARTAIVERTVVELKGEGLEIGSDEEDEEGGPEGVGARPSGDFYLQFWGEFLKGLELDAKDQPLPNPGRPGILRFPLSVGGRPHLSVKVYRYQQHGNVGVYLFARSGTIGQTVLARLREDRDAILEELGVETEWPAEEDASVPISYRPSGDLDDPEQRREALEWLRDRLNRYINVFRPRVEAIAEEIGLS